MSDPTTATLTRIDRALAANDSADAVAWLEAQFEERYTAYLAGTWRPSNFARPMVSLIDEREWDVVVVPADLVVSLTVDVSGFVADMQRLAAVTALSVEHVTDALQKLTTAVATPPPDALDERRSAMHAAYHHRTRARRRRNR